MYGEARRAEIQVALTITLHPGRGGVRGGTIHLRDDPLLRPEGIHLVAADSDVHLGEREQVLPAEVEEEVLKGTLGAGVPRAVKGEGRAQRR